MQLVKHKEQDSGLMVHESQLLHKLVVLPGESLYDYLIVC